MSRVLKTTRTPTAHPGAPRASPLPRQPHGFTLHQLGSQLRSAVTLAILQQLSSRTSGCHVDSKIEDIPSPREARGQRCPRDRPRVPLSAVSTSAWNSLRIRSLCTGRTCRREENQLRGHGAPTPSCLLPGPLRGWHSHKLHSDVCARGGSCQEDTSRRHQPP